MLVESKIEISEEYLKEAEKILIDGNEFDKHERTPFIKNLSSLDLLAVPGSGKTTALLAKLYCLSKTLPFSDGSGILVLSHTNAAITEIETRLRPTCTDLFRYPNFIGTLQKFINTFLFYPYYTQRSNRSGLRFDEGVYFKAIENILKWPQDGDVEYFKRKNKQIFFSARLWFDVNGEVIVADGVTNVPLTPPVPKKWVDEGTAQEKIEKLRKFIQSMKMKLLDQGIIHYDDCYYIARKALMCSPEIIEIIRKRFKFVFIDEMQDLEKYQIEIIDKLFYSVSATTVLQRIGDINQSIYNSARSIKVESDWDTRQETYLNDSMRLTPEVARIVNCFTLDSQKDEHGNSKFTVNGQRKLSNIIKPHLVIFDKVTMLKLKKCFSDLIEKHLLRTTIEGKRYGFHIIGWSSKWADEEMNNGRLRLSDMFPNYKKNDIERTSLAYDSLSKYISKNVPSINSIRAYRRNILHLLATVLKIEGKVKSLMIRGEEVKRAYTGDDIVRLLKSFPEGSEYNFLKQKLFDWSFSLATDTERSQVYASVKKFILNEFKMWFELEICADTSLFLGDNYEPEECQDKNYDMLGDDIRVNTVHSVKGQTHCATMYVETFNNKYESNKLRIIEKKATKRRPEIYLPQPLLGEMHSFRKEKDKRAKETLKMMYVGFSRPTHLLCFAVLKENLVENIDEYLSAGWEIVDLT